MPDISHSEGKGGERYKVLVLGGGLTGLAAAYRLLEIAGDRFEVIVLEKETKPGGQAISLKISDIITDLGPHRIHTELPEIRNFLLKFLGHKIFSVRRHSRMWLSGKWLHYPPVISELLKTLGKERMLKFALDYLLARSPYLPHRSKAQNYETAMLRLFGKGLYYFLLYPYTKKTWCVEPRELSADIISARITATPGKFLGRLLGFYRRQKGVSAYDTAVGEFLYTENGIQTLVDAFADFIIRRGGKIIYNTEVYKILPGAMFKCFIKSANKSSSEQALEADYVVNTLPITDFLPMLANLNMPAGVKNSLASLRYLAMLLVFVVVKKPRLSQDTWLYFPEERIPINRAYETKNFQHTLGPPDKTLLCGEITCFRNDTLWDAPDGEISKKVIDALLPCRLFSPEQVIHSSLYRLTHAYPLYCIDYNKHLETIWEFLRQFPRVITAGRQGLFHHNNMDHCIYEGFKAAECLKENPGHPASFWYPQIRDFFKLRIID